MARFSIKVVDPHEQVLARSQLEEDDQDSACYVARTAAAVFKARFRGYTGGRLVIEDEAGMPVVTIDLDEQLQQWIN